MPGPPALRTDAPQPASTALRCLLHPASLVALVLLGLNDHMWKGHGPAWLTGKLSDFAGLFYFPFLLLVIAGFLSPPRSAAAGQRRALRVFCGVGLWFAAAKTIPVIHAATVALAETFLGSVQIVMDPSDAMAVVVLVPAWLLYRRVAAQSPRPIARVAKPAVLGVALLLTAATSRSWAPSVKQLIVHEGQLYAYVGDYYNDSYEYDSPEFFTSTDGVTWTPTEVLPEEVMKEHVPLRAVQWQGEAMEAKDDTVVSATGKHTFRITEARQEYMRASGAMPWSVSDMALAPQSPTTLVVALQTQGVAVLDKDGVWARYGVGEVNPTPTRMSSSENMPRVAIMHALFGTSAALICWILTSLLVWRGRREGEFPSAKLQTEQVGLAKRMRLFLQNAKESYGRAFRGKGYMWRGTLCLVLPALIFWGHQSPSVFHGGVPVPVIPVFAFPLFALAGIMIAIGWNDFNARYKRSPKNTYFVASLPIGVLASGTLVLWDFGLLHSASSAIAVSALLILAKLTYVAGRLDGGNS